MEDLELKGLLENGEIVVSITEVGFRVSSLYQFPSSASTNFKHLHTNSGFQILEYPNCKVALQSLFSNIYLVFVCPTVPNVILKAAFRNSYDYVKLIYPDEKTFPYVFEEPLTSKSERSTSRSGRCTQREVMSLRQETFEKLKKSLDPLFLCLFGRIYPLLMYEAESFEQSPIVHPQMVLPLALDCNYLYFPVSHESEYAILSSMNSLYSDLAVETHEVVTIDPPSSVLHSAVFIYKGYTVAGHMPDNCLKAVYKEYFENKLQQRSWSSSQFCVTKRLYIDNEEKVVSLVATRDAVLGMIIIPLNESIEEYDNWFIERGYVVLRDLEESELFKTLNEEIGSRWIKPEVPRPKDWQESSEKTQDSVRKCKSVGASPISSPLRQRASVADIKKHVPSYLDQHDLHIYNYVLVNTEEKKAFTHLTYASEDWFMNIMRPLYCHYAQLAEVIRGKVQKHFEMKADFIYNLENMKLAVVKFAQFELYALYQGEIQRLEKLAIELSLS
mgnify:FL=1